MKSLPIAPIRLENYDSDSDGVLDGDEIANGTDQNEDTDGDGITDWADLCPTLNLSDQDDLDTDGIGDECDIDADGDGFISRA